MRIAFNNVNKRQVPSAKAATTNVAREFWRMLNAIRRITGGMDTGLFN
jgi:hypothetical protein